MNLWPLNLPQPRQDTKDLATYREAILSLEEDQQWRKAIDILEEALHLSFPCVALEMRFTMVHGPPQCRLYVDCRQPKFGKACCFSAFASTMAPAGAPPLSSGDLPLDFPATMANPFGRQLLPDCSQMKTHTVRQSRLKAQTIRHEINSSFSHFSQRFFKVHISLCRTQLTLTLVFALACNMASIPLNRGHSYESCIDYNMCKNILSPM